MEQFYIYKITNNMLGNTRVICNPLGYIDENKDFNPNLILEL